MEWVIRMAALGLGCLALFTAPARADWVQDIATLQCAPERNEALVRLGGENANTSATQWDALPESLSRVWPADAEAGHQECWLGDGRHVEMSLSLGQAFAYGMNGGVPAAWITLWIDDRVVLSRYLVRAGYVDQSGNDVSAILVASDTLRICDRRNSLPPHESKVAAYAKLDRDAEGCFTEALDLAARPVDALQKAAGDADAIGSYTVAATYNEAFCRRFIVPKSEWNYRRWIVRTGKEVIAYGPPLGELLPINVPDVKSDRYVRRVGGLTFMWDYFDFDNDGQTDTVILGSAGTHYMDGEMIFFKPGEHPDAAQALAAAETLEGYAAWAKANGFTQITGLETPYQTDRYTHFTIFRLDGSTFLFADPTNRAKRPSTVLYRYRTDSSSRWGRLDTVCMFQQILDND